MASNNNSRGVYLLIIDTVTDGTGETYKTATVYVHAELYCDIGSILNKRPNRLAVRVCPTLAMAKAYAKLEGATRYPVCVIQAGQL